MVKDAGEPVKNFVEMSKNDPKFKDYYRDFYRYQCANFKNPRKTARRFYEAKRARQINLR